MKFLFSLFVVTIAALSIFSCSHYIIDDDDDDPVENCDTLIFTDPDDAVLTPDFKSMTFYVYDSTIELAVELWEPYDTTDYPGDYMCFVYLYGTYRDMVYYGRHDYFINRDNDANGHFEQRLDEGTITWSNDKKTARIEFGRAIMPDFETKGVWAYSMVNKDRMPDTGRFYVADSLSKR